MKLVRMLVLAFGLVGLVAAPSFAAVPFNTTSTVNLMNVNAQTGLIGSILYTPIAPGTVQAGEIIRLNLPGNVPISYLPDITISVMGTQTAAFTEVFGNNLPPFTRIGGNTQFTTYGQAITANTTGTGGRSGISVTVNKYDLVISFGASVSFAAGDFIKIDGVRVDATAVAVHGGSLQVNLTNVSGQATTDTPQLIVASFTDQIMAFQSPIQTVDGLQQNSGIMFYANGQPYQDRNLVTVTLKELFPNAFETQTNGEKYYTRIKITVNIPADLPLRLTGVNLSGPDGATFTNGQYFWYGGAGAITTNPLQIAITSQSSNITESLVLGLTFGLPANNTQLMPMSSGPITLEALLDRPARVGVENYPLSSENVTGDYTYNQYSRQLRYKAGNSTSASIPVNLVPLTTNLLSVYNAAVRSKTQAGAFDWDTGFAITNLSGSNPITPSYPAITPGTIDVSLYPMDGSGPLAFNTSTLTSADAKNGLDSAGALPSKGTWIVLLSQLLGPAGFSSTGDFYGFIRFHCNFHEAAGISYLSDGAFMQTAQGYPMISDTPTNINLSVTGSVGESAITNGAATGTMVPPVF